LKQDKGEAMKYLRCVFPIASLLASCSMVEVLEPLPFDNPGDAMKWVRENIAYKSDLERFSLDDWQSPLETLSRRTGDCEDISILWMYLVQRDFSLETEMLVGIHKDFRNNHAWAASTDGKYVFYSANKNYLFIIHIGYRDAIMDSYK
jgi:hypothetical protein